MTQQTSKRQIIQAELQKTNDHLADLNTKWLSLRDSVELAKARRSELETALSIIDEMDNKY